VPAGGVSGNQKIIVLVPEAAGGSNIGIIVDEVHSVIKVPEEDTETMDGSFSSAAYIKGIIKLSRGEGSGRQAGKDLVVWIDVPKILGDLVTRGRGVA
jgi:purine-binding chemotaxis protein CheW